MADQVSDLKLVLDGVQVAVSTMKDRVDKLIGGLQNLPPAPDLTDLIVEAQGISDSIAQFHSAVGTVVTPENSVAPVETATPVDDVPPVV